MRKIRKISFFGILGVLTAVLFLASISLMQAQVQAKGKPDKPPGKPDKPGEEEATWEVQLPAIGADTMLYGDGDPYVNNGTDVIVKMERLTSILTKGRRAYTYYFCFKLVNPIDRYAGFQGVVLDDEQIYSTPYCLFPSECGESAPECMECFLNTFNQPYSGSGDEDDYEYLYLKFWVSEYSLPERDLEDMPIGTQYQYRFASGTNRIKFRIQNQEDFIDPETEYHNIDCDEVKVNYPMNIWIVRLVENKWRIYVGIDPADSGTKIGEELWVQETYTIRTKGRKTETVVPLEAVGNFSFYIDFIKNPTTQ